ncbi:MAG: HNH endonuclease [Stappia sp.]|uniref:HNH endonuclease n=1 Tax=Stappia sp. TaxID=1870903 RepID=UPI000C56F7E3|nr:HNH endonuclease [Stappia sp.]MAA99807.1 HNH endonuclease [Stappia sp.]MBM22316.1 HNH endonuclease [Stappia sp.]
MVQAVLYHKLDSAYDDITGERYHFPKMYLSRIEQTIGDWIVYYGPIPKRRGRFYSGLAKVREIVGDPNLASHFYAYLDDYLDFDRLVDYAEEGGYETKMFRADGSVNPGRSIQAVRLLLPTEFAAIVQAGLANPDEWPDRIDPPDTAPSVPGFGDVSQTPFISDEYERPVISQLLNRPFRDAKFRQNIRKIYDRTCAFTGLRLINGGGRPEVEAAHIQPVEHGGSDSIQNGIALSGTVHWMFDRGLLSLGDDFSILPSRQLNYDVSHLLHRDMKARVPEQPHLQPHPHYLAWHRENIFKS